MNIALIGHGKMGREIGKIALERHHSIVLIIDENNKHDLNSQMLKNIDVAIEFTNPESAIGNYMTCFESGVPVVSGTTGWLSKFDEVCQICKNNNFSFFYAPNFSIGVNIFFEINRHLAKIMDKFDDYDVKIKEIHHTAKLDAPSGTAIRIADDIIAEMNRKNAISESSQSLPDAIAIESIREGTVPGTHIVKYENDIDEIEISHAAKNRRGFAMGAVLAAEFLKDKKGVYGMQDLLKLNF